MVLPVLVPIAAGAGGYVANSVANSQDGRQQYSSSGCIDAHQIYQAITGGPGTASLHEGQAATSALQGKYQQRVAQIEQLDQKMDAAWTGDGAASARMGAQPLKVWMEDSNVNLGKSGTVLNNQSGAFEKIRTTVQPLPENPPESGFWNDVAPWETDTDRKIQEYNENAKLNVAAFEAYNSQSTQNASMMPQFSEMRGSFGDVSLAESDVARSDIAKDFVRDGGGYNDGGGGPHQRGPGGPGGPSDPNPGPGTPGPDTPGPGNPGPDNPGPDTPGPGNPGPGNPPDNTDPGTPGPGNPPDTPGPWDPWDPSRPGNPPSDDSTDSSGFDPTTPSVPNSPVGSSPYSPGASGPGFGPSGGGGNSSFSPGGGVAFGPGGSAGYGAGGGYGSGSTAGGATAAGPGSAAGAAGGRGGAMGTGGAAGGAGATGTAGAAGGRGGMMPMGAGGRGQQGDDDEEHERKFMIDEDGDKLFGTDQKTAPPVIGE